METPKGQGISPDDIVPDGFSYDVDQPKYRTYKDGINKLEYSVNGDELDVDFGEGTGTIMLQMVINAEGQTIKKIKGYTTDKLGTLSDETVLRYGQIVARQLGIDWQASIRFDGHKRYLEFTRQ